jgi:hypothetical protein
VELYLRAKEEKDRTGKTEVTTDKFFFIWFVSSAPPYVHRFSFSHILTL